MEKLEEMTGTATTNVMPSFVFLNFGPESQSAVGSTQDLGTDYSNTKKKKVAHDNFELDENGGAFSKRVENLWEKEKLRDKTKSPVRKVFSDICTVDMLTLNKGLFGKTFQVCGHYCYEPIT